MLASQKEALPVVSDAIHVIKVPLPGLGSNQGVEFRHTRDGAVIQVDFDNNILCRHIGEHILLSLLFDPL